MENTSPRIQNLVPVTPTTFSFIGEQGDRSIDDNGAQGVAARGRGTARSRGVGRGGATVSRGATSGRGRGTFARGTTRGRGRGNTGTREGNDVTSVGLGEEQDSTIHFKNLLGEMYGRSLQDRGLQKGIAVTLYVALSESIKKVGTAKLCDAEIGAVGLQPPPHRPQLSHDQGEDQLVVTKVEIEGDSNDLPYPYKFSIPVGPPKVLSELTEAGYYAWDTRLMIPIPPTEAQPATVSTKQASPVRKRKAREISATNSPSSERKKTTQEEVQFISQTDDGEKRGKQVQLKKFNLNDYFEIETSIDVLQTVAPADTARDIDPAHCEELMNAFTTNGFSYSAGRMMFTIGKADNPALRNLAVDDLIGDGKVKPGIKALIIDGLHRRSTIIKCREDKGITWARKPIQMVLKLRKDGLDMTGTEILALGVRQNNSTSAVRKSFRNFSDRMFTVVSYYKSFMKDYGLSNDKDIRIMDVALSIRQASVFRDSAEETCRRYARIGKVFLRHPEALETLKALDETLRVQIVGSHIDDKCYQTLDKDGVVLFLHAVGCYLNKKELKQPKGTSRGAIPAKMFYETLNKIYEVCRNLFNEHGRPRKMTFLQFLDFEVPLTRTRTISIRDSFMNQCGLFDFTKKKSCEKDNLRRIGLFESRVKNHFVKNTNDATTRNQAVRSSVQRPSRVRTQPKKFKPTLPQSQPQRPKKKVAKIVVSDDDDEVSDVPVISLTPEVVDEDSDSGEVETSQQEASQEMETEAVAGPTNDGNDGNGIALLLSASATVEATESAGASSEAPVTAAAAGQEVEHGQFDDFVPPKLPVGYEDPSPYKGHSNPSWQQALLLPPQDAEQVLENYKEDLHVTPWLDGLHVPEMHRSNWFFSLKHLSFLHRMAWLMAARWQLDATKSNIPDIPLYQNVWDEAERRYAIGYGASFFEKHREEIVQKGYTVLKDFADFKSVPDEVIKRMDNDEVYGMGGPQRNGMVQELFGFFMSTFPGEQAMKDPKNRNLWNAIINTGDEGKDSRNGNQGIGRFSSTRMLLMDEVEDSEEKVWAAVSRAFLDLWVAQVTALLQLRDFSSEKMWIPKTGGRLLLTGKDCPRQKPHNDFEVRDRDGVKQPGYFIIVSGDDEFPLWVCDFSHHFVYRSLTDRRRAARNMKLRSIIVPPNSVLIAHGYLTHAGAGEEDRVVEWPTMRYHMYLTPQSLTLPDAIQYAFEKDTKFTFLERSEE